MKNEVHTFWKPKAIHELVCGERGIQIFIVSQILNKISLRFSSPLCAKCHSYIDNLRLPASRYEYCICIFKEQCILWRLIMRVLIGLSSLSNFLLFNDLIESQISFIVKPGPGFKMSALSWQRKCFKHDDPYGIITTCSFLLKNLWSHLQWKWYLS